MQCEEEFSRSVVCFWVKPDQVVFCLVVCVMPSSRERDLRKVKTRTCGEDTGQTFKKDDLWAGDLNIGSITFSEHFPDGSVHRYE